MKQQAHFKPATFLVGCALLAGCASTISPPPSGFLGNYDELQTRPTDPGLLWWERDGFNWHDYRGVILDPLSVYYHPSAHGSEIRPEELQELTDAFREAVIRQLGEDFPVVDQAAPDILRVRCAITDVIPVRPAVNVVSSLVAFVAVDVGGAAIEVEFLDSVTGERLAAGVDQKLGKSIDGLSGFTRFGQAEKAFDEWAEELRIALETNP